MNAVTHMLRRFLFILSLSAVSLSAQTADHLNMGAQLEIDSSTTPAVWKFRWWGKTGRHYVAQTSTDLMSWHFAPDYNPSGADAILELNFIPSTTDKNFYRAIEFYPSETLDPVHDTDTNRLNDVWEMYYWEALGANAAADSDNDGLFNIEEYFYGTNPLNADTDGDGMSDGWEVAHGLDPKSNADAGGDLDGDTLTNLQEFTAKTNPRNARDATSGNTTGHDVVIVSPAGDCFGVNKTSGAISAVSSL